MKEHSNLKKNFSVLIPDGESPLALSVVRCLSEVRGLKINILSKNRYTPVRFSRYIKNYLYHDSSNTLDHLSTIDKMVRRTKSDIVLPIDQPMIELLSYHKKELSDLTFLVPLPQPDAFNITSNKWLLADFLKQNGLPHPQTILYEDEWKLDLIKELSFPVLIKPIKGFNGKGIKIIDDLTSLKYFFNKHRNSEESIFQSFIHGFDIDCSVLCKDGNILVYTIQKGIYPGRLQFAPPVGIEFLFDDQVLNIVTVLMNKLKWSGVAHIDLRYDEQDKKVKILEVNSRFWGSLLGSLNAGVNFPYLASLVGLKEDIPKIDYHFKKYIVPQATLGIIIKNLLRGRTTNFDFDYKFLKYILIDGLPVIVGFVFHGYNKIILYIVRVYNRISNVTVTFFNKK
jgi:D-aspartate ligase